MKKGLLASLNRRMRGCHYLITVDWPDRLTVFAPATLYSRFYLLAIGVHLQTDPTG